MERLTKQHYKKTDGYYMKCSEYCCKEDFSCEDCEKFDELVDRLAAIEDILGEEYDLERLRELTQADKQERCMVLPCDPGQIVWAVNSLEVSSHQIRQLVRGKDGDFACSLLKFPFEDFGRKVFLTREDAEAALRREQDD